MDRSKLTRTLVLVILAAALLSAPAYLFAEGFQTRYLFRVALSNGTCALFCIGLLALLRTGRGELAAQLLVFGLLALVGSLAWTNGEGVHVNVVNFVLVTVLAGVLLPRPALFGVALVAASLMVGIAWKQTGGRVGEELMEARLESIVQFLPTYAVIVTILALTAGATGSGSGEAATSEGA